MIVYEKLLTKDLATAAYTAESDRRLYNGYSIEIPVQKAKTLTKKKWKNVQIDLTIFLTKKHFLR